MDVFPLLSSHFSCLMCSPLDLSVFGFCFFLLYFVWLSLTGCRVTQSEHISHRIWTMECFIQSFTSWTSSSFCLFLLWAEAAKCFGDCDVYIVHDPKHHHLAEKGKERLWSAVSLSHHSKPCLQLKISYISLWFLKNYLKTIWIRLQLMKH